MRIGSFNQPGWDEGQNRAAEMPGVGSALTSFGFAFSRRVLNGLRFCRFEVRQTVQKGPGLAGDGWEQHMMTHEGLALRLLIRSLRLPSWELSGMELAL
ncbi:hypothetical protein MKX08_002992 [Trichoderma sp. CBMAI-0020]|nr:hypothetical protein MKX08_002992 [Trichoderma sp. CBMAI-0020]